MGDTALAMLAMAWAMVDTTDMESMPRGVLILRLRLTRTSMEDTALATALAMLAMALAMEDTMESMARGVLSLRLRLTRTSMEDMALAMALAMEDTMELDTMAGASKGIYWLISVFGYFCSSLFAFEKCLSSTDAQYKKESDLFAKYDSLTENTLSTAQK